ncbi:hypothetical protein GCM10010260_26900 [Streptomyces filipinensis]|uniref:Uncharacterized protein n=1 Tax=Streptomyces filipinensis TaxID=66887 RepID=A0A918IB68_9ACTN|nr:hypothetical protein GCM10010260_26900 [Streptomyces filipinensis]
MDSSGVRAAVRRGRAPGQAWHTRVTGRRERGMTVAMTLASFRPSRACRLSLGGPCPGRPPVIAAPSAGGPPRGAARGGGTTARPGAVAGARPGETPVPQGPEAPVGRAA